jgi:hypothetical protein
VTSNITALAYAAVAVSGVTGVIAATLRAGREHRAEPAAAPASPTPAAYVPCHTTVCAHMSTPHDRTAAGLVCRGCKTTKEEQ